MEIKMFVYVVFKDYYISIKDINLWIKNWGGVYFNIFYVGDIGWFN